MTRTALVIGIGSLSSCLDPTEVVMPITTDVECTHVAEVSIAAGPVSDIDVAPATARTKVCVDGKVGSLVVAPTTGTSSTIGIRVVAGLDGKSADDCVSSKFTGGCIVARRSLSYIAHKPLTLPVLLEGSCRDVACSPSSTCVHGLCVPSQVDCATNQTCTLGPGDGGVDASTPPSHWTTLKSDAAGRANHSAMWTGSEVWTWGGTLSSTSGYTNDGSRFSPKNNAWTPIPAALPQTTGRLGVAVWAGDRLLLWGGGLSLRDGAQFDGTTWTATADPTASGLSTFSGRKGHVLVWADPIKRLVVWGGDVGNATRTNDGALYNPLNGGSWSAMAPSPLSARQDTFGVMIGSKLVIYGGLCNNKLCDDAAVYDVVDNAWSPVIPAPPNTVGRSPSVALTDGTRAFFFFGLQGSNGPWFNDVVVVDPGKNTAEVRIGSPLAPRTDAAGWFANGLFWIWGGMGANGVLFGDGASYDYTNDKWTLMPTTGAPPARHVHSATWTGSSAIVFGGADAQGGELADTYAFTP